MSTTNGSSAYLNVSSSLDPWTTTTVPYGNYIVSDYSRWLNGQWQQVDQSSASNSEATEKIQKLEKEIEDLTRRLNDLQRELYGQMEQRLETQKLLKYISEHIDLVSIKALMDERPEGSGE